MDTAVGALRTTAVIFVIVGISFGVYVHQVAKITASTAAVAAAGAAVKVLDDAGWDCTSLHPGWAAAQEAAAQAAVERTVARSRATATSYTLAAEPSCTVVASVTAGAAGARTWLQATAVACSPTQASFAAGWSVTPPC